VETWGNNTFGQIGDATTIKRFAPVAVHGLTGIIQVAVGGGHVLALDSAGTVWSWGNNFYGELGNGTTSAIEGSNPTPVPVPGLNGIVQIAAGDDFSLALRGDGSVWAWGHNNSGQLGDGTTVDRDQPEQLPGLTGLVSKIIAGEAVSYAIRTDGTLLAWGDNSLGLLGKGTSGGFSATPAAVPGLTGVTRVASAAFTTLAVAGSAGTMWVWGSNPDGESGDGTATSHFTPEQTTLTGVTQVAAGRLMSAAVLSNGNLLTWGENTSGELGVGTHDTSTHPAPGLVRTLAGVSQVALSYFSALAIGSPAPRIPSVIGDTQAGAAQDLQAAGFVLGHVSIVVDITCEYVGEVKAQSPVAGTLDPPGTSVSVSIGKAGGKCL
jgi:alpha-tubulin suppressor-like RCC1 family protein